jgi:hypothetical protein
VSQIVGLKSLHSWCCTHICAYCLTMKSPPADSATASAASVLLTKVAKGAGSNGGVVMDSPLSLVLETVGAVSYSIHRQCQASMSSSSHLLLSSPFIHWGGTYQYAKPEDVECHLCGLKGGIMQAFAIKEESTSLPAPTGSTWVAHIPCCYYLVRSNYLTPIFTDDLSNGNVAQKDFDLSSEWRLKSCDRDGHVRLEKYFKSCVGTASVERSEVVPSSKQCIVVSNPSDGEEKSIVETSAESTTKEGTFTSIEIGEEEATAEPALITKSDGSRAHADAAEDGIEEGKVMEPILSQGDDALDEDEVEDDDAAKTQDTSLPPRSRFDLNLNRWRCALCGLNMGLSIRCAAFACTVRAHPVCAHMSDLSAHARIERRWRVCSLSPRRPEESYSQTPSQTVQSNIALALFCPLHSSIM